MTANIREPFEYESDECARLIYISGPNLFSYFYLEKAPRIYNIFNTFFKIRGNTFSRENIIIEQENGKIRGLIIALPVTDLRKLLLNEFKCIKEIKGSLINFLITMLKIAFRSKLVMYYPRLKQSELFISILLFLMNIEVGE